VFGARHPPRIVLAGNEPSLPVAGIAIGIVGRLAVDACAAGRVVPPHDAIVGDVAPIDATRIAEIDRPLGPAHSRGQPFNPGEQEAIFVETRIEDLNRWIGIAFARLPGCERFGRDRSGRRGSTDGCEDITSAMRASRFVFLWRKWN